MIAEVETVPEGHLSRLKDTIKIVGEVLFCTILILVVTRRSNSKGEPLTSSSRELELVLTAESDLSGISMSVEPRGGFQP
jgi:heme/copper-type cytochrome/quinol oxidase subunit 2